MTEGKEKAAAAKLDLDAKEATKKRAQEHLGTAREAVNEKHRHLLKTSSDDPLKVDADDDRIVGPANESFWVALRAWVLPQDFWVFPETTTHTRARATDIGKVPPANHPQTLACY